MAKIEGITKKVPEKCMLPNGWYVGRQGGYVVEVRVQHEVYEIKTDDGVRGMNIPVVVHIDGDNIQIETLKN
jgi:hypothetical protein